MRVEIKLETLQECFADLPDPRVVGRTAHRLQDILFLTLCGVLCGMDDEEEIEEWGAWAAGLAAPVRAPGEWYTVARYDH